jgi:hypothetical protein
MIKKNILPNESSSGKSKGHWIPKDANETKHIINAEKERNTLSLEYVWRVCFSQIEAERVKVGFLWLEVLVVVRQIIWVSAAPDYLSFGCSVVFIMVLQNKTLVLNTANYRICLDVNESQSMTLGSWPFCPFWAATLIHLYYYIVL